ncbi:MAG: PAS domain-containing sensor histidine kinase [Hymenobacteraceae bacterium]|nr:PAS domain-containing sensor histidine kinase [Hymenobacteraceae bacterium]
MSKILYTGLRQETLRLLQEHTQLQDVAFSEDTGVSPAAESLLTHDALLIGEEVHNPIRMAQEAYTRDKCISILIINDRTSHQQVKQALQFAPFIGPTVQCLSNEIKDKLAGVAEDAMQRTAQRRSYTKLKSMPLPAFSPNALEKVRVDYMAKVLEEAPIGAALISNQATILTINDYAARLFGKTEKAMLGTQLILLFPVAVQHELRAFVSSGYHTEEKKVIELKGGAESMFLEISVADIDKRNSSGYKIVILNDVSSVMLAQRRAQEHLLELERVNDDLKRVNADLDTFVYTASHDLKSPILNLEGLISLLEESLGPARTSVELELEHIKKTVQRFKDTVEDLTEVAKIQKGLEEEATSLNVCELLEDVLQLLQKEIADAGAILEVNCDDAPHLHFPKRNLRSILYNIIGNAIKYRSPQRKPHIKVTTTLEGGHFNLSIQDNGLGIPAGKKEKIFNLFKRMHTHVDGNGVGLYIVKRIVENQGGRINVESEEGIGTTFKLSFKASRN